jgi:hypothetical protein
VIEETHMANQPPDRESTSGIPRWVKMVGIILAVLVLLFVVVQLAGGGLGGHGPRRHSLGATWLLSALAGYLREGCPSWI